MLPHIKKISPQVGLLAFSLLVIAGLDVLFVAEYEKPVLLPAPQEKIVQKPATDNKFVTAEIGAKADTEETEEDTEEEPFTNEEFADHVKQFSTEFTPVKLDIPLQTEVKFVPFVATERTPSDKAAALPGEKKVAGKKKKADVPITHQQKKVAKRRICAKEALTTAVNVRSIQSKLMVAALSCPGAKARYNRFALKYSRPLKLNADVIMNYFKCKVGRKALVQFDKTITKIANAAAALNSKKHNDFCDDVDGIFDELDEAEAKDLTNVARRHFYLDEDFWKE